MRVDYHCHSTASDGTFTPEQLMELAQTVDIQEIALTDHDSVEGIERAAQASIERPLRFIPGVEISVSWREQTIHVLGLNINPQDKNLQTGLDGLQRFRVTRAEMIAQGLEQAGIPGALEGAKQCAGSHLISRTHFAKFLIDVGKARNMQDVFRHYLVKGKPGHVPGNWASLEQAVQWINDAGGIALIAHPGRYRVSASILRQLIEDFIDCDGQGLEIVSGSHTDKQNRDIAYYARRYNLFGSLGSDFHGEHHPWRKLGLTAGVPDGIKPVWESPQWDSVHI